MEPKRNKRKRPMSALTKRVNKEAAKAARNISRGHFQASAPRNTRTPEIRTFPSRLDQIPAVKVGSGTASGNTLHVPAKKHTIPKPRKRNINRYKGVNLSGRGKN